MGISEILGRVLKVDYLAPALIVLAATELYYWHARGLLCLCLLIAAAIARACFTRPQAAIEQVRGVPQIIKHMRKHLSDADEQMEGVILLLDATRSSASDRAERMDEIVREHGVHAVCEALVQHPEASRFVVPAYQLLSRLLLVSEARAKIIDQFNIDSLMGSIVTPLRVWLGAQQRTATKEKPPDVTLMAKGLSVVSLLTDAHVVMQEGAMELRVPELVVRTLDFVTKFPEPLGQLAPVASRCLFHTCYRHADCKSQFCIEAGGLRVLMRVLVLLPSNKETHLHALGLLFDCLSEIRGTNMLELRQLAIDYGILQLLRDVKREHSKTQTIVDTATQMENVLGKLAGAVAQQPVVARPP